MCRLRFLALPHLRASRMTVPAIQRGHGAKFGTRFRFQFCELRRHTGQWSSGLGILFHGCERDGF